MPEEKLKNILDRLIHLNQELTEVFNKERDCLLRNDIFGLKNVNSKEMKLGHNLKESEKERASVVEEIKKLYSIEANPVHIQHIVQVVEEPYKTTYTEKAITLKEVLTELMRIRNINNRVIERVLRFNEKNIKLFLTVGKKDLAYDQNGKMNQSIKQVINSVV